MNGLVCICISGFTQSRGRYQGILALREKLIEAGHNNGPAFRVWYLDWKENFQRVAADMSIVANKHGIKFSVLVAGYSYGGWGALQMCRELEGLGISVDALVLSDPVARPWWLARPIPAASSMLGRNYSRRLHVPGNVSDGSVHEFYQRTNRPQGHRLKFTRPAQYGASIELPRRHIVMDDAPEFHECTMREAKRLKELAIGKEEQ